MKTARDQGWHFLLEKLAQVGMVNEARPSLSSWDLWMEMRPTSHPSEGHSYGPLVALPFAWAGMAEQDG